MLPTKWTIGWLLRSAAMAPSPAVVPFARYLSPIAASREAGCGGSKVHRDDRAFPARKRPRRRRRGLPHGAGGGSLRWSTLVARLTYKGRGDGGDAWNECSMPARSPGRAVVRLTRPGATFLLLPLWVCSPVPPARPLPPDRRGS